jgi:hypothetical protein
LTLPVLIILAVLWAVVLLPPLLRSRSQRTADSIVDFNFKLDVLGRTNGNLEAPVDESPSLTRPVGFSPAAGSPVTVSPVTVSPVMGSPVMGSPGVRATPVRPNPLVRPNPMVHAGAAARSARRRRDVMRALALAVVGTLLLAFVTHSVAVWVLQGLADVLAAAYVALWAWMRSVNADRLAKVRYIPDLRVAEMRVPEMALRRSASS